MRPEIGLEDTRLTSVMRRGKARQREEESCLTFYQFSLRCCSGLLQRGNYINFSNLSLFLPLCHERTVS